jgi:hypothetical protein
MGLYWTEMGLVEKTNGFNGGSSWIGDLDGPSTVSGHLRSAVGCCSKIRFLTQWMKMVLKSDFFHAVPFGKHTKNYGKSPFFMGKSTINGHFQ